MHVTIPVFLSFRFVLSVFHLRFKTRSISYVNRRIKSNLKAVRIGSLVETVLISVPGAFRL